MTQESSMRQDPIVLVIDFHHARGPEIELCFANEGSNPAVENDWSLLPFMALSDGAHASTEDFSYFTLRREATSTQKATSLFGISCTRQIPASSLIKRAPDVTRSTVQKAVVVVTDGPRHFGTLREKLSMVTSAWFAQRDFSDVDILKKFRESLIASLKNEEAQKDTYLGLSLREMIHAFKSQTLVLFKCLLLQPKMLFFGSRCERLCMIQFSLLSLIPGLLSNLQDCADPTFDSYAENAEKATSLKTSERSSLLAYMGLPLQLFGKGSIFGPYTPLQQLDLLADHGTKSYVVGSTNSLLLQQKDRYSDILINLDEGSISIHSPSLRTALALTAADRRWVDFLTQTINETWDPAHPEQPKTHGYVGSEEFIRLQFEEYLLALLASINNRQHVQPLSPGRTAEMKSKGQSTDAEGDPTLDFNADFIAHWQTTRNYALFHRLTSDALLFSIVEPRHPYAGGLTIDDIQRRLAQQVSELHLDERVREGREALNKTLASGQKKVSSAFNSFWADIEALREAQRKKNEEKTAATTERLSSDDKSIRSESMQSGRNGAVSPTSENSSSFSWFGSRRPPSVDISQAQASMNVAGQKAGAYISSWGAWASERRREWQERRSNTATTSSTLSTPRTSSETTPRKSTGLPSVNEEKTELSDHNHQPNNDITTIQQSTETPPSRHQSEEESSSSTSLGRSMSRRKRWSSVLRMKDHHHHHHHRSDSDTESYTSRKGSLDIPRRGSASSTSVLSVSAGGTDGIPKSPLGQKQMVIQGDEHDHDDVPTASISKISVVEGGEIKDDVTDSTSTSPESEETRANTKVDEVTKSDDGSGK
ncbi:Avl9 protein, putative [Talaromyces stipitatus ATCC 10500]|uniref:Avl9 protein, putative n=1 Tax=Talaromyces stipitatus (strain ATCC 10500 / CBS 375.48 / QM 6759 / NRRL 1006) TaxID=441959 RepID=B8M2C3_TALSN|nr:Avl9 protein, putative [Talaromyces stipitatus ATCC 10500]EED21587.1 Avl9 protein, putative [Talaromyces stipitatus ATCC 10500]